MRWKNILLLFITSIVFILGCTSNRGKKNTTDTTKSRREIVYNEAKALIEKMVRLADQRQWYELESVFASKTVFNYGAPELLSPTQVVDRFKLVLSYFDRTNQEISNFQYRESQGHLYGSANYINRYEKGSDVTLRGQYEYEFFRDSSDELKIMRLTVIPGSGIGNDKLLERATKTRSSENINYTVETVEFSSKGERIVGWLYKPNNPKSRDVVILSGVITTVKEQFVSYAQEIVQKGFPVLIFDFSGHGESEGRIRNIEDPELKIQNLLSVINYVTARSEYEHSKVSLVSFGDAAGFTAKESVSDPRVSRLVMIAPWINDPELFRNQLGKPEDFDVLVKRGEAAREKYFEKDIIEYVPLFSTTDSSAVFYSKDGGKLDYYYDPSRGSIPQWQNRFAVMSWKPMITFNALEIAPLVKIPTLIIETSNPMLPEATRRFSALMRIKPEIKKISTQTINIYHQHLILEKVVKMTIDFLNKEIQLAPVRQAEEELITP